MPLVIESPTVLRLEGFTGPRLRLLGQHLEYVDKKVDHEIRMFKNSSPYFIARHGEEEYKDRLTALKATRVKSLLFTDDKGHWTYSGLAAHLANLMDEQVTNKVLYPAPKSIPWAVVPTNKLRYYQENSIEKLLDVNHGAVELGTGLGKSLVIVHLLKRLGLQSVVMAPSDSIATQLYNTLLEHFGKKYVGKYYGGKKQLGKLFTVAIGQSLTRVTKESNPEAYEFFQAAKVFIADESHMTPAETLNSVCMELVNTAPYRFFLSGTQVRGDGKGLVLEGIIGPIAYSMTVSEGIDQGFLSKMKFFSIKLKSENANYTSKDPMRMTRKHLYYNANVNNWAAEIANESVFKHNRQVLILVKEVEQFAALLPYLRADVRFAHGGALDADMKAKIPEQYHSSDNDKLVEQFNNCEFQILVGTSCISTGTDIKSASTVIFLMGNSSETMTKQAVGRGTRLYPGKQDCLFYDFDVEDVQLVHNQAIKRMAFYKEIGPVRVVQVG